MSTLLTGLVTLFRMRENENAKAIARLEEKVAITETKAEKCEQDRTVLYASCEVLKVKLETLEKRIESINVDGTQFSHTLDGQKGKA